MRTIIAGSRSITDYATVVAALAACGWMPSVVISGHAPTGVDRLGERYARDMRLPVMLYPAQWSVYGKRAGRVRNAEMGGVAEALVAVWDGQSPGTKHMIAIAKSYGIRVYVHFTPRLLASE